MLNASKNMEKPQLKFTDPVDNSRTSIFSPKITYKHNLLKPLAVLYEEGDTP